MFYQKMYGDVWDKEKYLNWMYENLMSIKSVMSETASIYVHLDYHIGHYMKVLMDEIFGEDNFRNEIIWKRATAHSDAEFYGNNFDCIYFYTKSQEQYVFNTVYVPYDEDYAARFRRSDPDGRKWDDRDLSAKGLQGGGYTYEYKGCTSLWRCPIETMEKLDSEGRLYFTKNGGIRRKLYLDELPGMPVQSMWMDINPVNSQAIERSDYGKRGKTACSPHQIREADLKTIVLDDLRRVTHFARMKERQFAQYINQRNTTELRREINRLQRELDSMHRRYDELSALFKRLYEDNVLGRVTNEQFRMLSADYNAEQKNLSVTIPAKEEQLEKLKASAANVDAFIEKAKRYTTIDELKPELLRLFIQRIEVGERSQKYSRSAAQSVRIVYRDIGRVDSPMQEGEHAPNITKQITDIEEIKRLLA